MKFYIQDKRPIVTEFTMPAVKYGVYVSFTPVNELPLSYADKWLADFASLEDAESYRARKEKEHKC